MGTHVLYFILSANCPEVFSTFKDTAGTCRQMMVSQTLNMLDNVILSVFVILLNSTKKVLMGFDFGLNSSS